MARPRAADDFVVIKRRMEELQRERAQAMRRHGTTITALAGAYGVPLSCRGRAILCGD
jgi:hypothetical protein